MDAAAAADNRGKHDEDRARSWKLDPFSTAIAFPDWHELRASPRLYRPPPGYEPLHVWRPRTWLLSRAFQRLPRPSVYDVPSARSPRASLER